MPLVFTGGTAPCVVRAHEFPGTPGPSSHCWAKPRVLAHKTHWLPSQELHSPTTSERDRTIVTRLPDTGNLALGKLWQILVSRIPWPSEMSHRGRTAAWSRRHVAGSDGPSSLRDSVVEDANTWHTASGYKRCGHCGTDDSHQETSCRWR